MQGLLRRTLLIKKDSTKEIRRERLHRGRENQAATGGASCRNHPAFYLSSQGVRRSGKGKFLKGDHLHLYQGWERDYDSDYLSQGNRVGRSAQEKKKGRLSD